MTPEQALRWLETKGCEGEVYELKQRSYGIEIKRGEVELVEAGEQHGFAIRVLLAHRMGFAYGNELTQELLDKALSVARVSPRDEHLAFAGEQSYPSVRGIYDSRLASLSFDELEDKLEAMLAPAQSLGVEVTQVSIAWEVSEERMFNSHGVEVSEEGTEIYAHLSAVAKRGDDVATGLYFDASRSFNLDFEAVGETASRLAKESLGAQRLETGDYAVVLRPMAMAELVENVLIPAFSADNVQRGRSRLAGMLDEQVFGEELSVVDDATLEAGLESSRFDGEGTACRSKALVEKGVLRGYLYDIYTARKDGVESTGNAFRSGFSTLPRIDASNFIIQGNGGLDEDEALVVHGLIGAHTANPVTGDFSVETRNAFYGGSPVRKAILAGNVYDLLSSVSGFGRDVTQISGVVTPSVGFSNVRVVG